jgi:hypothetical protein
VKKGIVKNRQNAHARKRAEERFGIQLTKTVRREILAQIHSGKARLIIRHSWSRATFGVKVGDQEIPVIYNKSTKAIVTVLPPEELTPKPSIASEVIP